MTPTDRRPPSQDEEPYLSVVAVSRNDNHGGDLTARMQHFVTGFLRQCRRHQLRAELILVDWNPPPDRPLLADELDYPAEGGPCDVRIVVVPAERHAQLKNAEVMPLFQMAGKNIGIRRAKGQFVLATNIDILFSPELMQVFAERALEPGRMYRVDRHDVPPLVPNDSLDETIDFCQRNVVQISDRWGSVAGWKARRGRRLVPPVRVRPYLEDLGLKELDRPRLHYNACGDFTLLSRDAWHDLKGYPEFPIHSWNVDSYFVLTAHMSGYRELALRPPRVIWHINHGGGYVPGQELGLFRRLLFKGVPVLSTALFYDLAIEMRRTGEVPTYNDENWGMGDEDLPETIIYSVQNDGT